MLSDYLGVRLNGPKAAGKVIKLNVDLTDIGKTYSLIVENGVLNYSRKLVDGADAHLTLTKDTLDNIQLKQITIDQAMDRVRSRSTERRRLSPTSSVFSIPSPSGSTS